MAQPPCSAPAEGLLSRPFCLVTWLLSSQPAPGCSPDTPTHPEPHWSPLGSVRKEDSTPIAPGGKHWEEPPAGACGDLGLETGPSGASRALLLVPPSSEVLPMGLAQTQE